MLEIGLTNSKLGNSVLAEVQKTVLPHPSDLPLLGSGVVQLQSPPHLVRNSKNLGRTYHPPELKNGKIAKQWHRQQAQDLVAGADPSKGHYSRVDPRIVACPLRHRPHIHDINHVPRFQA